MKQLLLSLGLMLCILPANYSQGSTIPRMGEGAIARSSSAAFWVNTAILTPSVFISKEGVDPWMSRKWWRTPPVLPRLTNNDLTKKITREGELVWVQSVIEGGVSLYREPIMNEEIIRRSDFGFEARAIPRFRYWMGVSLVEEVNDQNYRRLVKKHLPEAQDLHKKLGRLGFRFENLPSMIVYYNRFHLKEPLQIHIQTTTELLLN